MRKRCEICSNLTIETPERRRFGVFTVNFEHISHLFSSVLKIDFEQVNISWEVKMVYYTLLRLNTYKSSATFHEAFHSDKQISAVYLKPSYALKIKNPEHLFLD